MAGRRGKTGITIAGVFGGVAIILITIIVIIQTGAWALVAPQFGLTPITSISQLLPGEDSMRKANIGLGLKKPTFTTPDNSGGSTATPDTSTGDSLTTNGLTLPAAASSPLSISDAITATEQLETAAPHPKGYNRAEEFGDWQNSDQLCGYGTTRDLILKRDMSNVVMNSNCKVQSGTLNDPYTGTVINFQKSVVSKGKTVSGDSTAVQIDHVVALNDAWASGLWKTDRKNDRVKYANDPDVLLASQGDANNAKSEGINLYNAGVPKKSLGRWTASTPSVWLPSNTGYQCDYMAKRIYIKQKYQLSMSSWEKSETLAFLQQCQASGR